jgi:hypothetical protein
MLLSAAACRWNVANYLPRLTAPLHGVVRYPLLISRVASHIPTALADAEVAPVDVRPT